MNRQSDIKAIREYGKSRIRNKDLENISFASQHHGTSNYGIHIDHPDTSENWYDALSSMMQSLHSTSISSLNDDNREDEKEIEILQAASEIKDSDFAQIDDLENLYVQKEVEALRSGNKTAAKYWGTQVAEIQKLRNQRLDTLNKADEIVRRDKQLFTLKDDKNPILEAIGEIIDYTTTGASIGAAGGGAIGSVGGVTAVAGAAIGGILGAIGGALYGGYDYIASGRSQIDRSSFTEPLSEDRNVNYANAIKTRESYKQFRANQIEDEQQDLLDWQTNYKVSDYYRMMEQSGKGNYMYYNMPGIVGSSFSDTKDMGQQAVNAYGLSKLAKIAPKGKWALRGLAFAEALRNGWQASLNENHAEADETATRKAVDEIKKNKALNDEITQNARQAAMKQYGISEDEAKEWIDTEAAFTMYNSNIAGLNPRDLENQYEYYKNARRLGDNGAETQFERDMMATAGGDVLEAALMVTPYGAIAGRSKVFGRFVAGAGAGAVAGEFLGFGVPGSIIGGAVGGMAAQVPIARKMWRSTMKRVQAIEDNVLPKLQNQIVFDKFRHAAGAFGATALAEAAEEGTQYLNSLDAEKILTEADDKLDLRNIKNLFANDLKKRGEVFKAVLSQIGLADSPYQNDQEFWQNWKGGLFLGGLMTGAMTSFKEAAGAKKAYQAAKFVQNEVLSSAVANRTETQDAILKGVAFAKHGVGGHMEDILNVIERAKNKNRNRENTPFTDKDFDDLSEQASRVISLAENRVVQNRLKDLGYKIGSEEASYALSTYVYYLKQLENLRRESAKEMPDIQQNLNSEGVLQWLDAVAGPEILNDEGNDTQGQFKVKERQEDGTVVEYFISNRERYRRLHQDTLRLISVTQLLKDLQSTSDLVSWAKDRGLAFSSNQIQRSISELKKERDALKQKVEYYSEQNYDDTSTYDQQIEYLKTLVGDYNESGEKLVDLYRNQFLRALNEKVYKNILSAIGLGVSADPTVQESRKASHDMVNMFIKNVKKNEQLQEVIDYNITTNSRDAGPSEQDAAASSPDIDDTQFEDKSAEEIAEQLTQPGGLDQNEADQLTNEKLKEAMEERDRADRKIFGQRKAKKFAGLVDKWKKVRTLLFGDKYDYTIEDVEDEEVEEGPITDTPEDEEIGPGFVVSEESSTVEVVEEEEEQELDDTDVDVVEESEQPGVDEAPVDDEVLVDDVEPADNQTIQDTAPVEDDSQSAIVHEDQSEQDLINQNANNQQDSIDRLNTVDPRNPRQILPGWYITNDGKILPSERMYMANPVETKAGMKDDKGVPLSEKYMRVAARVRFAIHRYLNENGKTDQERLINLRNFVSSTLKTTDVSIVDPIAKALLNNDKNASKLLIMYSNPRTWFSYYVNEYFRSAFNKILSGKPVERAEYIDPEVFRTFCAKAIQYKRVMENRFGWKFIEPTPSVTQVDGQDIIGNPDIVAVDTAGNIHIVNVHTMRNDDYKRWGNRPISMDNTKSMFSIMAERSAYADIQMKALQSKPGVQVSSCMLLPIVVDEYAAVHRLYMGKLIPVIPSEEAVTKYKDQEDQFESIKLLVQEANKKAKDWADYINSTIEHIKAFRAAHRTSGYRFKNKFEFTPEAEPASIAEAYAQLDRAQQFIDRVKKFRSDHLQNELNQIQKTEEEEKQSNKKSDVSKTIQHINAMPDESKTGGVLVDIIDADDIVNNKDVIENGKVKMTLVHTPEGTNYISCSLEYKGKSYKIHLRKPKIYGQKNGGYGRQMAPSYSKKIDAIAQLLAENPDVTVTVDLKRSYVTYDQKESNSKPTPLNDRESIISEKDIDNLGVQQDDGKIVDIGFYDEKSGVIQSGQRSDSAVLGYAPEGDNWWQNQLFLVIKQRHSEDKQPERRVSIPLIKSKFDAKIANFIAQCFKVIAETNHTADTENQNRRTLANQMLHLFIGQRLTYKKGEYELPNIVYTNGDAVRLNGNEYILTDEQQFKDFAKELRKCELMPRWDTFNVKFKNLADSSFSVLYDHFSTSDLDFNIAIDGVDSGLRISKKGFENDTLCQWLVRNGFLSSKWFVKNQLQFSLHNLSVGGQVEEQVKEELKEKAQPVQNNKQDEVIDMTEEELKAQGYTIVEEEDDDEDADYSSPIVGSAQKEYNKISRLEDGYQAIDLISTKYKALSKLLKAAAKKAGMPKITFVVSKEQGEWKEINGVKRQKKGSAEANEDGSWTITFYQGNPNPIKTLAHEMVHVYTLGAIDRSTDYVRAAKVFYSTCKELFSEEERKLYGFKNFKEFVAEFFTNPEMIELLKSKEPIPQTVMKTIGDIAPNKPKNMLQSVISFISKVWQKYILKRKPNAYDQIYNVMSELLQDSYRYIGTESVEDAMSIQDIMGKVVDDIKEKLTSRKKKGYSYTNHATQKTVKLQHCDSPAELRAAIDGIMTAWIRHEDISPLGKNIDKLKFSTEDIQARIAEDPDFAQWWYETFEKSDIPLVRELTQTVNPTKEELKSETNPKGYVQYKKEVRSKKRVNGKLVTVKKEETFYKVEMSNWDAVVPIIDEFMADMRIETRKKVEFRKEDEEMEAREDGRNVWGELLTESMEISPLERASREVKWMFSTVPAEKPNALGMEVFMPFRDVFGKVLYYTSRCHTTDDVILEFAKRAMTGPDKAMFAYLHDRLVAMKQSVWRPQEDIKSGNVKLKSNNTTNAEGRVLDADIESSLIKVMRTLRQQQNDFVWATAWDNVDNEGEKTKSIEIRTTLYQKGVIMAISSWRDQLATGLSGVLKYDTKEQKYKYQNGKDGLFRQIYNDLFVGKESFIYAYNKAREQDAEDITVHWRYLGEEGVPFSEITADDIKTYLHNALLELGVDVRQEVIDQWIGQIMEQNPTVANELDAIYVMLSDQNSQHRPVNFFSRLAEEKDITADMLIDAFNSGFIKELANLQNEYDLRTQSLMTVASHNNQYYIVSESNYINDVAKILDKMDQEDEYIQMLQEDSFAQGSVVSEALRNGEKLDIHVSTFVGMKTRNIGDQGRDYFEIGLDEDIISKFELLHEGYMISPTQSDKKTYHVLRGIPLVGMLLGKRTNTDCYDTDIKFNQVSIRDKKILDRFIAYFESEKNAVEKAIVAQENEFYKKNPGKKIANYSDKNGTRFSSFNSIPLANGETIYLNVVGNTPRQNLQNAYTYFFNQDKETQRAIMSRILIQRAKQDMAKAEEVGLITKDADGLYQNIGLDGATILEMATNIGQRLFGNNKGGGQFQLKKHPVEGGKTEYGPNSKACISAAVQQYILDCSIKHLMSMQEYQRLFSGSKSFYKWRDNGTHVTDISIDYTKRRGGDISTGGVNVTDIDPLQGMEEMGTYRCIEVKDYEVESNTLGVKALTEQFELSEFASIASVIKSEKASSTMDLTNMNLPENMYEDKEEAERIVRERYGDDFVNIIKQKAKSDAMQYFKEKEDDDAPVNVADGATYITDVMCEKLLREEGKWDDNMKYAFEVLRGKHGVDVLSKEGQKLYKSILDVVIGTQKYTATGFRRSDDGQGGTLMTPYYNKTALFPIFDKICYGKMTEMLGMMRANGVDMLMMTSAVKVGSQGAITFDELVSGRDNKDHVYVQEMRFLRKQLNTDPNEREEMNLGTQTIKIALSNLRMNDDYIDPFTGKKVKGRELYKTIMRAYNILTDIGFEQVMQRFCKKDVNGNPTYINAVPKLGLREQELFSTLREDGSVDADELAHMSLPDIDEKALSKFLHEELMSRDANDNMFDAIAYDEENDRLAAPLSAISGSGWIDSILASYINKTIIDTKSPGAAYIQRSVFAMEGDGLRTINNGEELQLINEDGSMDAVISIDFFKDVIPNYAKLTFEEARKWLIDHKLVGKEAKTYTISYRIPTQAQSSINPLKFVDVIPIVRDTIILPKEFTKLTGSDFDIDKLFLSRLFINPDSVNNEDQMFTFFDDNFGSSSDKLENMRKAYTNQLFQQYLTLLMDDHSHKTKWRPIDADTKLWKDVYDDLYSSSQEPIQSLQQDTIAYQAEQKDNFVTGKIGIGPYALNNNNHIYTMLYGISLNPTSRLHNLGPDHLDMGTLCRDTDIYGNSILSWLSGGINAHVDIAKDPFVTKMNINGYTYNISNFLLRAGFGRNALWFLNLPVIKELSKRMNAINGQYLRATNKDEFEAREEIMAKYKQELIDAIPQEAKDRVIKVNDKFDEKFKQLLGRDLTVNDLLFAQHKVRSAIQAADPALLESWTKDWSQFAKEIVDPRDIALAVFEKVCDEMVEKGFLNDMVEKDKSKSILYRMVKGEQTPGIIKYGEVSDPALYNYMAVLVFDRINSKEAKTTSDLTKFAKIDTKKQGSTVAAQIDFLHQYNKFVSKQFGDRPDITGDVRGFFGILSSNDLMGFDTQLMMSRRFQENALSSTTPGDILDAGYIARERKDPTASFIENKTKKAINSLMSIIRNDSIEGTYGFQVIWERIKADYGRGSLSDDAQSKLRSAILGAIKSMWLSSAMEAHGLDPITLFKDTDTTKSLAHELVALKTKRVFDTGADGKKRIISVKEKFKDNALLNILHDAHTKDDYLESDKLIDILDFIMVHIPFTDDTKKSNVYINAWRELYNDSATKDFAVKLMFYSLLTSNDTGGNNLFKYVPFEMLQEYGLFDAEREMINFLGDPSMVLAKISEGIRKLSEESIENIVYRVESILAEDYEFSKPYKLESKKEYQDRVDGRITRYDRQEYIGFGNVFGIHVVNKSGKTEDSTRIPYVFIPARMDKDGNMLRSETLVDRFGHVINRAYIRVLNPIANYENQQKYLTYKRIGEINTPTGILPIYRLVDSSMYTLGQYKIYNYENQMDISNSQAVSNMRKYTYSSDLSLQELNDFIQEAVLAINRTKHKDGVNLKTIIEPLTEVDQYIKKKHMQQQYEFRIYSIKNNILAKYEDYQYLREYQSKNDTGKEQMLRDLQFVLNSAAFTQEEKIVATDMLSTIKQWIAHKQQNVQGNKQPNTDNDPRAYAMHSGGADGSDTYWADTAKQYGMIDDPKHIAHYYYQKRTPNGNVEISKEDYEEGVTHVFTANQVLNRKPGSYMSLLARNWAQVKYSDGIFAIGTLKNGGVDGGTGWAVQMAIDAGKPVHVFDLSTGKWYQYDHMQSTFIAEDTPKLTKNFAGIGTRSIDPEIERKTNGKVKYVGDAMRQAALDAMDDVFRNTFGDPKPKSPDTSEFNGKNNPQENFNGPKESQEVLESPNTILSNKELLKLKPYTGSDTNPRIAVASEHSDPAFIANQLVDLFDKGKPLTVKSEKWAPSGRKTSEGKDIYEKQTVETTYTADDFDALYIVTKHDGIPMKRILQTKIPKLIHFSVTGMGGTSWEPGVMKYQDMLDRIKDFIKMGLDPEMVTMRIDPIIPGVTPFETIEDIVKQSAAMGIKRIKFSVMDWYQSTAPEVIKSTGYDYSKYYEPELDAKGQPIIYWWCPRDKDGKPIPGENGKPQWEKHTKYRKDAKIEEQKKISDFMLSLKDKYGVTLQSCAEPLIQEGIEKTGCLSVQAINNMLGTHIVDKGVDNNKQRALCTCYGGKTDLMDYDKNCASTCWYCYAHHQGDKVLNYYNEDGTLKDNIYTRTTEEVQQHSKINPSVIKKHEGYWTRREAENNPKTLYVFTDNTDRDSGSNLVAEDSWYSKKYGPGPIHYPTSTAAVVRGLDNARPISTMHFFYKTHGHSHPAYDKSSKALWHDSDIEEFKKVIGSELQDIVEAFNSGNYDSIMFPDGDGLFNTNLSQISKERTPELYRALSNLLKEYGFDKLIPKEPEIQLSVDPESWSKKEGWSIGYFNKNVLPRINVSSYGPYAHLSNFAVRKFVTSVSKKFGEFPVDSVEQAFQLSKAAFAYSRGDITEKEFYEIAKKMMSTTNGKTLRQLGKSFVLSPASKAEWDSGLSDKVLFIQMKRSFEQNAEAAKALLETGNAEITHNYENGNPIEPSNPTRFGRLLSKVRSDIRDQKQTETNCK